MFSLQDWKNLIGKPSYDSYDKTPKLIKKYFFDEFDGELYLQPNGLLPNGKVIYQEVFVALPKNLEKGKKLPAVAVPFYTYEWTLGMNVETGEKLKNKTALLYDLVKRGYICATAVAYHLSYIPGSVDEGPVWENASGAVMKDNPNWTGMGKFIEDTKRLIDILDDDERVDSDKIGLAGHSLGGKISLYTGFLDERIKVIVASDFGLLWNQTDWQDNRYWGKKVYDLKDKGVSNVDFLSIFPPKPLCVIVGYYDDDNTVKALYNIKGYKERRENLFIINHARGHKPPKYALDGAYGFLDRFLK